MTFNDRRKYWLQAARQMRRFELQYAAKVQRLIKEQVGVVIKEAEVIGFQMAVQKWPMFNEKFIALLMELYKKVGLSFALQVNRILKAEERKDLFYNGDIIQRIVNVLGTHALSLVTRMDETTKQQVLNIITEGEQNQLSYREIALNIEASWIMQYARALTITRTEVGRAANVGSMEAASSSAYLLQKEWIAGKDSITRRFGKRDEYDHWQMDGVVVEMLDKFQQQGLKGITAVASHPGDPEAPAAFTINCRCVVGFIPKRDANGKLIKK